ncbi:MAG: oligosaccharide flippase family protein [Methanobrevibacter sp.]|nr:oligosaccharide flippase family protein [Methanobrevibacter sp.]
MLRQLLKDSIIYGIGGILTKGINLILLPIYVRILTPEDYGIIDFLLVFFTLAGVFFSLEIYQAIARYYCEFNNEKERKENISTAYLFICLSYFLFILLVILNSKKITDIFFNDYTGNQLSIVISIAALATYFNVLFSFCGNILRYSLKAKIFAICSFTNSILNIALSIIFVIYLKFGIKGIFLGQLTGNIISWLMAFINTKESYSLHFDIKKLKTLLKFSLPLVPSSIGVFLLSYLDRIVIKYYLTLSDLGIYGVANRFSSISIFLMMSISTAITPLIYANYKKEKTTNEIAIIFSLLSGFIIVFISGITLFSKEILYIFTAPDYYNAASLLPFLLLAGFLSKMYDFTPGLAIAKKTKTIAIIYLLGAAITITINVLTIKIFGIFAVACANCFSALFVFIINYIFSQKYYKILYKIKPIIIVCLISIVIITISNKIINQITLVSIIFKMIILFVICILPCIFHIIDISYIKKIIKLIIFRK